MVSGSAYSPIVQSCSWHGTSGDGHNMVRTCAKRPRNGRPNSGRVALLASTGELFSVASLVPRHSTLPASLRSTVRFAVSLLDDRQRRRRRKRPPCASAPRAHAYTRIGAYVYRSHLARRFRLLFLLLRRASNARARYVRRNYFPRTVL